MKNANLEVRVFNENKAKPCPFCGGEAQMVRNITDFGIYYYVECVSCGSRTKGHCASYKQFDDTAFEWMNPMTAKAVKIWNMRG